MNLNAEISRDQPRNLQELAARLVATGGGNDDALQESWLINAGALRPLAYLRGIARNRLRMEQRSEHRRRQRESAWASIHNTQISELVEEVHNRKLTELIHEALHELSQEEQNLLLARFFYDEEPSQIAKRLGLNPSTVRTRLSRAQARLREGLARQGFTRKDLLPAVLLVPPTSKTPFSLLLKGVFMKLSTKFILVSLGACIAIATWIAFKHPSNNPSNVLLLDDEERTDFHTAIQTETETETSSAVPLAEQSQTWLQRRKIAQRARQQHKKIDSLSSLISTQIATENSETEQFLSFLRQVTNKPQLEAQLETSVGQVLKDTLRSCLEYANIDPKSKHLTGELHMHTRVLGETGVDTVFDEFEIGEDSVKNPQFTECLRESLHSITLPEFMAPVDSEISFVLDLQNQKFKLEFTDLNFDNIDPNQFLAKDPSLFMEFIEYILKKDSDTLLLLQEWLNHNPNLNERYPELEKIILQD